MADQMYLVITLRKPVEDREEAREIYDWVKHKMQPRPEVLISGHATNHFDMEEP